MNRSFSARFTRIAAVLAAAALVAGTAPGEAQEGRSGLVIPQNATALEGIPRVRIDTTRDTVTRRELAAAEAAKSRLTIRIDDGRLYWASRDDRLLTRTASEEFTYLLSTVPGRYVRIRELNDTLTYVEHLDMPSGSVTYWGELRIVVRK
jgi:hypothetical protein